MLPYRRYTTDSLLPLVEQYLGEDGQSYQRIAAPNGRVRGYDTPDGQQQIDERALHRTTVLRWVLFLGGQAAALQAGLKLWMEREPLTTIHHFVGAVSPRKFRSEQRGERLRTARRLLHFIAHWDRAFPEAFFPRFATKPRDS